MHKIYLRVFKQRHKVKLYANFSHRVLIFQNGLENQNGCNQTWPVKTADTINQSVEAKNMQTRQAREMAGDSIHLDDLGLFLIG